jgi:hypothetical protein
VTREKIGALCEVDELLKGIQRDMAAKEAADL